MSVWVDMFYVCLVCGKSSVSGLCVIVWAVVLVVSLLYAGVVRCVSRLKYIPVAAGRLSEPVSR